MPIKQTSQVRRKPHRFNSYRVAIRGAQPGESFCACPDFATNDLGTCKHVEFVLGRLEKKRGGKQALTQGSAASSLAAGEFRPDHVKT